MQSSVFSIGVDTHRCTPAKRRERGEGGSPNLHTAWGRGSTQPVNLALSGLQDFEPLFTASCHRGDGCPGCLGRKTFPTWMPLLNTFPRTHGAKERRASWRPCALIQAAKCVAVPAVSKQESLGSKSGE